MMAADAARHPHSLWPGYPPYPSGAGHQPGRGSRPLWTAPDLLQRYRAGCQERIIGKRGEDRKGIENQLAQAVRARLRYLLATPFGGTLNRSSANSHCPRSPPGSQTRSCLAMGISVTYAVGGPAAGRRPHSRHRRPSYERRDDSLGQNSATLTCRSNWWCGGKVTTYGILRRRYRQNVRCGVAGEFVPAYKRLALRKLPDDGSPFATTATRWGGFCSVFRTFLACLVDNLIRGCTL